METIKFLNKEGQKVTATLTQSEYDNLSYHWVLDNGMGFSSKNSLRIFMKESGFYSLSEVMGSKSKCFN